ncbi:MAG: hypothetical protein HUN04_25440 [Desulfobacter sp.]|nr:MAG: hypothetical protein HUN04_25440 [Desulfobacter sp.]
MLKIRNEQMKIFRQVALRNFEDGMVEHCLDFAPQHSLALGEKGIRKVVQLGISQAEAYGFTNYGPVQFYIEMMFMLGSYFDTDCQLPWAGQILADPGIKNQEKRADRLFEKTMDYLERVGGPNREYAVASLGRASGEAFESACRSSGPLETDILPRLKHNFPEKCSYVGDTALMELIARGKKEAATYSVSSDPGIICFIFFMFMMGEGFARDPLYPWCGDTLNDETVDDPEKRPEILFRKGLVYINKALENLGNKGR